MEGGLKVKRVFYLFLVIAVLVTAVATAEAGRCNKQKDRKAPEFGITPCQVFAPWPYKCKKCGDLDNDGIDDCIDKCPGTPALATIDEKGCPSDSDGDGVYDGIDKCPDTPKGATVDATGCPMDSDGDGVYDGIDKCPDTPKGATVDATGCPMDSDGDGVYDGIDKCPDTPKELAVDEFGCPIKVSETETKFLDTGVISTTAINFKFNKAEVTTESYPALDEIGEILVKWPELKVEIGGHTDSKGSESYNMKLSGERADAVKAYLVKKFPSLNTGNLTTKGYGEGSPVATNDTEEGRASNRRVEFKALNPEELKRETETQHYKKR